MFIDNKYVEDKKQQGQYLKIDSDMFNDTKSVNNRSSRFSNSPGTENFDLDP